MNGKGRGKKEQVMLDLCLVLFSACTVSLLVCLVGYLFVIVAKL